VAAEGTGDSSERNERERAVRGALSVVQRQRSLESIPPSGAVWSIRRVHCPGNTSFRSDSTAFSGLILCLRLSKERNEPLVSVAERRQVVPQTSLERLIDGK